MGWIEIVSVILNLVLGGTVLKQLGTLKSVKLEAAANAKKAAANAKEADASAQSSELANVEAAIKIWRNMAQEMATDRAMLAEQVEELSSEVRRLKNATNRMARLLDRITPENMTETIDIIRKEIGDEYSNVSNNLNTIASRVPNKN